MPKRYLDLDKFIYTNDYRNLKKAADDQHLILLPYEYAHHTDLEHAGSYFVICANEKFKQDLCDDDTAFERLLEDKRMHGVTLFNPCYQVIDVTDYMDDINGFCEYQNTLTAIEKMSNVINSFRAIGKDDYPDTVPEEFVDDIIKMNVAYEQAKTNKNRAQERKIKSVLSSLVNRIYNVSMKISGIHFRPLVTGQRVGKDYFMNNKVTPHFERVNNYFIPYFQEQIKNDPSFYYYLEDKLATKSMDLKSFFDNLFKGNDSVKNTPEIREYDIIFPFGKRDTFYKIMMAFNTRNYHAEPFPQALGDLKDLMTMRVPIYNLDAFDELCHTMGVRYYINHGEYEFMDIEATENPIVVFHKNDLSTIKQITGRIAIQMTERHFLSKEAVNDAISHIDTGHEYYRRNNTYVGEPHDARRKNFAAALGYSDLARD